MRGAVGRGGRETVNHRKGEELGKGAATDGHALAASTKPTMESTAAIGEVRDSLADQRRFGAMTDGRPSLSRAPRGSWSRPQERVESAEGLYHAYVEGGPRAYFMAGLSALAHPLVEGVKYLGRAWSRGAVGGGPLMIFSWLLRDNLYADKVHHLDFGLKSPFYVLGTKDVARRGGAFIKLPENRIIRSEQAEIYERDGKMFLRNLNEDALVWVNDLLHWKPVKLGEDRMLANGNYVVLGESPEWLSGEKWDPQRHSVFRVEYDRQVAEYGRLVELAKTDVESLERIPGVRPYLAKLVGHTEAHIRYVYDPILNEMTAFGLSEAQQKTVLRSFVSGDSAFEVMAIFRIPYFLASARKLGWSAGDFTAFVEGLHRDGLFPIVTHSKVKRWADFGGTAGFIPPDIANPAGSQVHTTRDPIYGFGVSIGLPFDSTSLGSPRDATAPEGAKLLKGLAEFTGLESYFRSGSGPSKEFKERGFDSREETEFLIKYVWAPRAAHRYQGPNVKFYERELLFPLPEKGDGGDVLDLPRYSSKIFWRPNKQYWQLRTDFDHLPGGDRDPRAHYWTVQHGETLVGSNGRGIPIYADSKLHTSMRSKFLPDLVVDVDIFLRQDPVSGRDQVVVVERFSREDPKLRGTLPPW